MEEKTFKPSGFSQVEKKPLRFPMTKFSLRLNHYLKNHLHENPRRFFISRLLRDRGGQVELQAPGGGYKVVLVVFVLVVSAGEKHPYVFL